MIDPSEHGEPMPGTEDQLVRADGLTALVMLAFTAPVGLAVAWKFHDPGFLE
jgi:hypothetical protein